MMELDEIDPAEWAKLETATDEYIFANDTLFDDAAKTLCSGLGHRPMADASALRLGMLQSCFLSFLVVSCGTPVVHPCLGHAPLIALQQWSCFTRSSVACSQNGSLGY